MEEQGEGGALMAADGMPLAMPQHRMVQLVSNLAATLPPVGLRLQPWSLQPVDVASALPDSLLPSSPPAEGTSSRPRRLDWRTDLSPGTPRAANTASTSPGPTALDRTMSPGTGTNTGTAVELMAAGLPGGERALLAASRWYLVAAGAGEPICQHWVGLARWEAGQRSQAIGWWRKAMNAGHAPSALMLGARLLLVLFNGCNVVSSMHGQHGHCSLACFLCLCVCVCVGGGG